MSSTPSTSIHDIKTLILSFHPVVVIETVEEDRVISILSRVAAQLSLPYLSLVHYPRSGTLSRQDEPLQD